MSIDARMWVVGWLKGASWNIKPPERRRGYTYWKRSGAMDEGGHRL